MTATAPEIKHPRRAGPRPLPLHLSTAAMTWLSSAAALPFLKNGSLATDGPELVNLAAQPWHRSLHKQVDALLPALAAADPDSLAAAVGREVRRRLDEFERGLTRYRKHPYHRDLTLPRATWRDGTTALRDYVGIEGAPEDGLPLLVVPSLVNRAYVVDLTSERSLLRFLCRQGFRPFLVDWDRPGARERRFDLGDYIVDPQVEREVRAAAAALADAGAIVEEVELGWTREVADAWGEHWSVYLAAWFGDVLPEFGDRMDPTVRRLIEHGLRMDAVAFKRLELVRQDAWERLAAVHRSYDALLCPTMAQLPMPIDTDEYEQYRTQDDGRYFALDMTSQFNFTSPCPALSVPAGWSDESLPVGLQIVARKHRDDLALRIGRAVETVRPWADRRPPL